MALKNEGFGRYAVVCDDPYRRGCGEQVGPYFGHNRAVRIAEESKWYVSEATDKHSCPTCMGLHGMTVEKKLANGSMTREEADNSSDPFTAAFIAMAFGGDPLTAGLITMFTGSTSLGIIAGIMAGDHTTHSEEKPFEEGGGQFGGGGASAAFDDPQTNPNISNVPENVSEKAEETTQQGSPVIVDPFESRQELNESEASQPDVKAESETFQPLADSSDGPAGTDTDTGTSY
ncbi:hypothetical protein A3G55_01100 [Candidatus Giovannonibacteria bacterium RIFCSPLOWO2_12_FULL_44_25]|uniref:Uncharacterized protein n=3 Tax=Candidatus Giovannoniibacteriota TaxID=1752738 RepID=A0A0G1L8C0_9BACT|nr:MAG: hypothetical protein UW15_C0018G0015 [Parcubacteria group bacterium GW2011_GWC1_44_10]KKT56314.1 MAG: hypothetical protein UW49_C0015G0004 [Candidatus Giovannonibacteria bacterium GW2011_GWB1_44_23]KKT59327.1 MAG: hypothetical protein UW53_C0015G0010 [Candidatus Giovannonibacteria bacterium GW2011_GWA1_44_25]OGF49476.1 MAG: hypothetical protein A2120_03130 [Candidatus Giovannonibacteria bacterium GWA2_45_15]OGF59431.1 MAG: hypothetical protein A2W40_00740 [Candidatus Giovannonibacteria 